MNSYNTAETDLLSMHYRTFLFTDPLDLKPRACNPAQKSIGTPKLYRDKFPNKMKNSLFAFYASLNILCSAGIHNITGQNIF